MKNKIKTFLEYLPATAIAVFTAGFIGLGITDIIYRKTTPINNRPQIVPEDLVDYAKAEGKKWDWEILLYLNQIKKLNPKLVKKEYVGKQLRGSYFEDFGEYKYFSEIGARLELPDINRNGKVGSLNDNLEK